MGELGTLLVRAREARGLTIEDAERDTRISRRYLQALESEQFDVIPAPVYARGFLRSYSQYLGIDPQEALAMFPREDDAVPVPGTPRQRPSIQQPASAVGAARPEWRRPTPPQTGQQRSEGAVQRPIRREPPRRDHVPELPLEPVIGVDIGVPAPNRRIKTDPAAQTRSVVIAVVAIAAVVAVILLAFLISNLGSKGRSNAPTAGGTISSGSTSGPAGQLTAAPRASASTVPSANPGVMPNIVGQTSVAAKAALTSAGIKFTEKPQKSARPKGEVIDQSPSADTQVSAGFTATIVVSDGP
jgi:transcriptional regulator with XRE-family HTH domain